MRRLMHQMIVAAIGLMVALALPAACSAADFFYVDVPFQFLAGDKVLPAGPYRVDVDPVFRRLLIRPEAGGTGVFVGAVAARQEAKLEKCVLLFHKYGRSYALHQAATAGAEAYQVPLSKAEREMAKAATQTELAYVNPRVAR